MIDQSPSLAPNTSRDARTLARCHDRLARRRAEAGAVKRYRLERIALLGFGVLYLSSLALDMIRVLTS